MLILIYLLRRFEAFVQMGKSPTCELLYDWGTTNCTVGDLVDLLIRNQFLAPARLLVPGNCYSFTYYTVFSVSKMLKSFTVIQKSERVRLKQLKVNVFSIICTNLVCFESYSLHMVAVYNLLMMLMCLLILVNIGINAVCFL